MTISQELNNILNEMGKTMSRVETNTANLANAVDRMGNELDALAQSQSSVNSRLIILETYDLKSTLHNLHKEIDSLKVRAATLESQQSNWSKWLNWGFTVAQMLLVAYIAFKLGINPNP